MQAKQIQYQPGKDEFEVMRVKVKDKWGVVYQGLNRPEYLRFSRTLLTVLNDFKNMQKQYLKSVYPDLELK